MRYFIDGNLKEVPVVVDATYGDALLEGERAVGCGVVLYVATGESVTFAVATKKPTVAPVTATLGPGRYEEMLGPRSNIYVTAITGTPAFRQF